LVSDPGAAYGSAFVLKLDADGFPLAARALAWTPSTSFCGSYRPISIAFAVTGSLYVAGGACLAPGSELLKLSP
jgi:hypothetical protein